MRSTRSSGSEESFHTGCRPLRGDRRVRLGCHRPTQARPAAVRLRRRAVPTPRRGRALCTTRPTPTSPPTRSTLARSPWSALAPRRPRGPVAHAARVAAHPDGLGAIVRPGRRAALDWAARITASEQLSLYQQPRLPWVRTCSTTRGHQVDADVPNGRILRSVLMKPETAEHVPQCTSRSSTKATARAAQRRQVAARRASGLCGLFTIGGVVGA